VLSTAPAFSFFPARLSARCLDPERQAQGTLLDPWAACDRLPIAKVAQSLAESLARSLTLHRKSVTEKRHRKAVPVQLANRKRLAFQLALSQHTH